MSLTNASPRGIPYPFVLHPWDGLGVQDQWVYFVVPRSPSLMAQISDPSTTSQGNR